VRLRSSLDQVFLTQRPGAVEALLVWELESGRRERETLHLAVGDAAAAAALLGATLARRPDVVDVARCRLRLKGPNALRDDRGLLHALATAFRAERRRPEGP
jgi:hypothetical protein